MCHAKLRCGVVAFLIGGATLALEAQPPANNSPANNSGDSTLAMEMLQAWSGPYGGVPPWDRVRPDQFPAACKLALSEGLREYEQIANNSNPPTFANTIAAMEDAGRIVQRFQTVFRVHVSNLNVGPMADIEKQIVPQLAQYEDQITQNAKLFARIEAVYKGAEFTTLSPAQQRLTENRYREFVRKGARLTAEEKQKLTQFNTRLSTLYAQFSQNVLADEQGYVTWIEKEADLAGLPPSIVAAMSAAAKDRGREGQWAVTNTRSSMDPFLTYAKNRKLREQVWRNYYSRADNGDAHDNNALIVEILRLRARRAKLLGYETHAHWRLEPQMAKTPDAAMELLLRVWPKAVQRVREEVADMQRIADAEDPGVTIEPWDYRYYAEKVRKAKYDLDLNEVKPYLQLEKLREGMMWTAGELFGLRFEQVHDVPVYHPDIRVWKVTSASGDPVGMWYFDPYAREGKRSGAWMSAYRPQERKPQVITPIVSNNSNFIKGKPEEPVLISWDDATTLFHEFGHALHGLLSQVDYPSQAGTAVARDYVEFPSQLNEHWLSTDEVLKQFAVHYETGKPLPAPLAEKIERAATFNQGFATVEYLASALIDMRLHLLGEADVNPDQFERKTLDELGMPRELVMRHRTPHFSHIFSSDAYSAGYYSYLWSDTLTADAARVFEEAGSYFDKATAKRLQERVLSVGDTVDPAEGFRAFRGRDVDISALMNKRGFSAD